MSDKKSSKSEDFFWTAIFSQINGLFDKDKIMVRALVARMIMYLNIRYGETFSIVGTIELFLKWNIEDHVSAFEEQRNNVIYAAQGNRNVFIDNPYLATLIWEGNNAAGQKHYKLSIFKRY